MNLLPNPYILIGGVVALASVSGTIWYQGREIHRYHKLYNCSEYGIDCPKGKENIPQLRETIKTLTDAQNNQTLKTDQTVIKIVQGPKEVQSIIREINAAPVTKDCKVAPDSEEIQNAF